ncbi:plasmid stabilization protein [Ignatzschineria indica]|uniref:Plasmid stabilization protein n=1 Tax=Ignatzschineria indica TaxID=472583 RepID=A0A2U2AJ99_9GAMM|nr:type II toxin-antitoxin system RelE/ParE family toxin [Ignatzschineria indica]PWD82740.1 plasmid stabilization protein [Ignatzschineria indica]GGZ86459.1 plasmid stabilization protein [Ignatzschineria indica]
MIDNRQITQSTLAEQDIENALLYYMEESARFALSFIDDLEKTIQHIGEHPSSGSTRYAYELGIPNLRSWQLKRFPYLIFYMEEDNSIYVWRVLHAHSDIPSWMK